MGGFSSAPSVQNTPWLPSDNNLVYADGSLDGLASTFVPIAGTVYLQKIVPRKITPLSSLMYIVSGAGVGASTGSFGGLYNSSGVLLSQSADIGAALLISQAVPASQNVVTQLLPGQFYWSALLCNLATTQPTIRALAAPSFLLNANLPATAYRFCFNGTGLTALPASFNPAANTVVGAPIWVGINLCLICG